MRVIHLSDTHLGYSAYRAIDVPTGLNQRELDMYNAFNFVIDYIVKEKPDLVIHAGDLFDNVRPNNRAIFEVMKQLMRLSKENIPIIIIMGNHSNPRQRSTSPIFKIFSYLPNVHMVYTEGYSKIVIKDTAIHVIPHSFSPNVMKDAYKNIHLDKTVKFNILTSHVGVTGTKVFKMGEFNEQIIPFGYLKDDFDYIALGHYHKFIKLKENAYYSGSIERLSFEEADSKKYFLDINLDNKDIKKIEIPTRPMIDFPEIDCKILGATDIMKKILTLFDETSVENKIIRLKLKNIKREIYRLMDFKSIKEKTMKATHFEINHEILNVKNKGIARTNNSIGSLDNEFVDYIFNEKIPEINMDDIKKLGLKYFKQLKDEAEQDDY
jgi:DNA repair exonuclease SbcCD nuclease subunit